MKNKTTIIASLFLISQIALWAWVHYLNLGLAVDLENLTKRQSSLLSEQETLRLEAAKLTSLNRLEKEADRLGLVNLSSSMILSLPKTIALKPQ